MILIPSGLKHYSIYTKLYLLPGGPPESFLPGAATGAILMRSSSTGSQPPLHRTRAFGADLQDHPERLLIPRTLHVRPRQDTGPPC